MNSVRAALAFEDFESPFQHLQTIARSFAETQDEFIDLSMINSDMEPSRFAIDKFAETAIKPQYHRYAVSRGIRRLREAFAQRYERIFSISVDPENEVCVTQGAKDGVVQLLEVLANDSRKIVLVGCPYYPAHILAAQLAGLTVKLVALTGNEETDLERWKEALQQTGVRAVLFNYPSNPSGTVISKQFWKEVLTVAAEKKVVAINDFVYGELCYNASGLGSSMLSELPAGCQAIEVYSLSKAFSVAGWRIGAVVGNGEIVHKVAKRKSLTGFGIFLPLQIASAALLTTQQDLISAARERYESRVRFLGAGLKNLGWEVQIPQAGICVWAKPPSSQGTSYELSETMIREHGVFASPGSYFGSEKPFLRFACVVPQTKLQVVLDKLSR